MYMYFRSARSRSLFILASTLGDIGDKRWAREGGRNAKRNKHVREGDNVIEETVQRFAKLCKWMRGRGGGGGAERAIKG